MSSLLSRDIPTETCRQASATVSTAMAEKDLMSDEFFFGTNQVNPRNSGRSASRPLFPNPTFSSCSLSTAPVATNCLANLRLSSDVPSVMDRISKCAANCQDRPLGATFRPDTRNHENPSYGALSPSLNGGGYRLPHVPLAQYNLAMTAPTGSSSTASGMQTMAIRPRHFENSSKVGVPGPNGRAVRNSRDFSSLSETGCAIIPLSKHLSAVRFQ